MDKDLKKKIDSFYRFYFRILIFSPFEKDDTKQYREFIIKILMMLLLEDFL